METKHEKFTRMLDVRLPKAIKAIELLGNLSTRDYDPLVAQVDSMFTDLYDAVDAVADRFGTATPDPVLPAPEPVVPTEGTIVLTHKSDIPEKYGGREVDWAYAAWAHDMLLRGDIDDAKVLLHKALKLNREG